MVGKNSVFEQWKSLQKAFASSSHARVMEVKLQLQTSRKGNLSIDDYFDKVKGLSDQLSTIGHPD